MATEKWQSGFEGKTETLEKLADFAARYKDEKTRGEISEQEFSDIDNLIGANGRELTENSSLYAEYTSENIAFIDLPNGLYIEVSISGHFTVSFVDVYDEEGYKARLAQIEKVNKELEERKSE